MTRDDIIAMAREAGAFKDNPLPELWEAFFISFAALVAAHEREECAKVCDAVHAREVLANPAEKCAAAIRARGQE